VNSLEHSFEIDLTWGTKIQELDLIGKKKQALDRLLASERISKSTFEYLEKKLTEETVNLEAQLKSLSDSMTARAQDLEQKIRQLEISLANLEMCHVTGQIDDKTYGIHNATILLGLEAAKQELGNVKDSLLNALSGAVTIEELRKPEKEEVAPVEIPKAEEPEEVQEAEERTIFETPAAECSQPCETVESAEPIQEVVTEPASAEPIQSEVSPPATCSGESDQPVEKTEAISE